MSDTYKGKTLQNALIGVVVTTIAYFVPVLNAVAPVFGGSVAGYLQKQGAGGGMKAGGAKGALTVLPAIPIAIIGGAMLADIPVIGELLAGSIILVVVIILLHSIALGLIGGLLGGVVSGS